MFKNLAVYRFSRLNNFSVDGFQTALSAKALQPCAASEEHSAGWLPVREHESPVLFYESQSQIFLKMGMERKILPSSVVNQFTKERIAAIEESQGFNVSRKQAKEIKEATYLELLPRAFVSRAEVGVWIDTVNGFFVVNTPSLKKAEDVISLLHHTFDTKELSVSMLAVEVSPSSAMTEWIASETAPADFTIDRELELRGADDAVRYVNHSLEGEEVRQHIAAGKHSTRLSMTWDNRISFSLTDTFQIKKLNFLDVESIKQTEDWEAEFALFAGSTSQLINALVCALGGLRKEAE